MDPLSVVGAAAASAQFVSQGINLVKFLWELYSQMNSTPESIHRQIIQIKQLLSLSKLFLENASLQKDSVASILGTCLLRAQEFHAILMKLSSTDKDGRLKKLRAVFKSLMMEKDVIKIFESLERDKCTLILCIQQVDATLLHTIHTDIKDIKGDLEEVAHVVNDTAHNLTTVVGALPTMSAQVTEIHTIVKSLQNFTMNLPASAGNPASRCRITPHHIVPNRRVREFVGREDVLSKIEFAFSSANISRTAVVRGLGGQGKTQVALEYCRRAKAGGVRVILWVDASSENSVQKSFESISECIKDREEKLQDETRVKFVIDTLEALEEPWLVVFDNHDDPSTFNLQEYMPESDHRCILVTSRHADTDCLADPEFAIELQGLPPDDALDLLFKQCRSRRTESNAQDGKLIIARLGYHALAITQAGSYINLRKIGLGEFLGDYNKELNRMELFNQTPQMSQYRRKLNDSAKETTLNVFTTWELSFQQLQEQQAPSIQRSQILTLFAFFDCKNISEHLFQPYFRRKMLTIDSEVLRESFIRSFADNRGDWDHRAFTGVVSDLAQISLVQAWSRVEPDECRLSLHPLIKDWVRLRTDIASFQDYTVIAAQILSDRLESCYRHTQFELSLFNKQKLLSHLDAYRENFESLKTHLSPNAFEARYNDLEMSEGWFSRFLRHSGQLAEAGEMGRRLAAWHEAEFGLENERTLSILGNLARILEDQGKYGESEDIVRRVLNHRQTSLGREHLDTLVSLHNLAFLLGRQRKYQEAEHLNRFVLKHRQTNLGQEHPESLVSMSSLASLLSCQGKFQEAEDIDRSVLKCREQVLGVDHADTITSLNNLGLDLRAQAKYEESEDLLQRALLYNESEFGPEHQDTLCNVWNLALLKEDQQQHADALAYYERACRGCKKVLGIDHPNTVQSEEVYLHLLEKLGRTKVSPGGPYL